MSERFIFLPSLTDAIISGDTTKQKEIKPWRELKEKRIHSAQNGQMHGHNFTISTEFIPLSVAR